MLIYDESNHEELCIILYDLTHCFQWHELINMLLIVEILLLLFCHYVCKYFLLLKFNSRILMVIKNISVSTSHKKSLFILTKVFLALSFMNTGSLRKKGPLWIFSKGWVIFSKKVFEL